MAMIGVAMRRPACAFPPFPRPPSTPLAPAMPSAAPWPPRWRRSTAPSPNTSASRPAMRRARPSARARPSPCPASPRRAPSPTCKIAGAMRIGPYTLAPNVILAPMAGVTDKPFRVLCKRMGAGLCVSEMTTSDPRFWNTAKSLHRMDHVDEPAPVSVQIAGTVPEVMAQAARHNVDHGAQIVDINMGCPAKKVCHAWAGSALMRDEGLVARILEAMVGAVDVPVTLKIRTGWAADRRNALTIARIAESAGIAALAIHGRTRDQQYTGTAEYDTIAEVKAALAIPVIANGDIDSPEKAAAAPRRGGRGSSARSRITWPRANTSRRRTCLKSATSCSAISTPFMRSTASNPACASHASTWAGTRRTVLKT